VFKSNKTSKYILIVLGLIGSLTWLSIFSFPDSKLHLIFCDVGQGDAILITRGFDQILIDGGPNDKVLSCLADNMPFWDKKIEVVALTHPEADHLTGLLSVLDKYEVEYFLTGPEGNNSAGYQELLTRLTKSEILNSKSEIKDTNFQNPEFKTFEKLKFLSFGFVSNFVLRASDLTRVVNPYSGEKIKVGEIVLKSLWPEEEWAEAVLGTSTTSDHLNDFSLVFLMEYKDKKVLLMGDADSRVQYKFIDNLTALPIDILKFPHHGSKTGITEEFLQKISPKVAVISVGKNSYGHPSDFTLDLLKKFNIIIRRTDIEGEIKYTF